MQHKRFRSSNFIELTNKILNVTESLCVCVGGGVFFCFLFFFAHKAYMYVHIVPQLSSIIWKKTFIWGELWGCYSIVYLNECNSQCKKIIFAFSPIRSPFLKFSRTSIIPLSKLHFAHEISQLGGVLRL